MGITPSSFSSWLFDSSLSLLFPLPRITNHLGQGERHHAEGCMAPGW
jgi:hypothetical protein